MSSPSHLVTALDVNRFYQQSTPLIKGSDLYLDFHSTWAGYRSKGIHYLNLLYITPTSFSFIDCQYDYKENRNLYAMMLPPSCRVSLVNPRTSLALQKSSSWLETDLKYSLTLNKLCHVIVTYQYSGVGIKPVYTPMRIKINSSVKKHTVSSPGLSKLMGNYGLWQGSLGAGSNEIVIEYRSSQTVTSGTSDWQTRALTIIHCC